MRWNGYLTSMTVYGIHASHEQAHPSVLLAAVQRAEYAELGFDEIALHHVGQEQDEFIDAFGAKVLPELSSTGSRS